MGIELHNLIVCLLVLFGVTELRAQDSLSREYDYVFIEPTEALNDDFQDQILEKVSLSELSREWLTNTNRFTEKEIDSIMDYMVANSPLLSPYELIHMENISKEKLDILLSMLLVEEKLEKKRGVNGEILTRFQFNTRNLSEYRHPLKQINRVKLSVNQNFTLNIMNEKDPGEKFTFEKRYKRYGYDFHSFYLQWRSRSEKWKFIAGDFSIESGQGIVFSAGLFAGSGGVIPGNAFRWRNVMKGYSSSVENGFMKGVATSFMIKEKVKIMPFVSYNFEDVVLKSEEGNVFFNAVRASGYHRTTSEILSKDQLGVLKFGNVAVMNVKDFEMGINNLIIRYSFEKKVNRTLSAMHGFNGQFAFVNSLFYKKKANNKWLYGEVATNGTGKIGGVQGFLLNASKKADISLHFRYYQPGFYSPNGGAFSRYSSNENEKGVNLGINYNISRYIKLSSNIDLYRNIWVRSNVLQPSSGAINRLALDWKKRNSFFLKMQYLLRNEKKNIPVIEVYKTQNWKKHQWLFHLEIPLSAKWNWRSRIQGNLIYFVEKRSSGYLVYQEFIYTIMSGQMAFRLLNFDTEGFENRIYSYEKDVQYTFNMPSFQGKGFRAYFYAKYKFKIPVVLWLKAGILQRNNDLHKFRYEKEKYFYDLKFQVRYKF